jgi:hypothetical protein
MFLPYPKSMFRIPRRTEIKIIFPVILFENLYLAGYIKAVDIIICFEKDLLWSQSEAH